MTDTKKDVGSQQKQDRMNEDQQGDLSTKGGQEKRQDSEERGNKRDQAEKQ